MNLLIDMKLIENKDIWKLEFFMALRNQFMHNIYATTLVKCFKFLDGSQKKILQNYPQNTTLELEVQLYKAVSRLCDDILKSFLDIAMGVFKDRENKRDNSENRIYKTANKHTLEILTNNALKTQTPDLISLKEYHRTLNEQIKLLTKDVKEELSDIQLIISAYGFI